MQNPNTCRIVADPDPNLKKFCPNSIFFFFLKGQSHEKVGEIRPWDGSLTVRKAKRDTGPQHKGDGKFRHPYR
jgi:hypothetical protein